MVPILRIVLPLVLVSAVLAKPGSEAILDQKDYTATLYLAGVRVEDNGNVGAQFLLIPPSLEKACLGKTWAECRKLRPKEKRFGKHRPTQVLDHWVYGEAAKKIPTAAAAIVAAGKTVSLAVDAKRSIRAKIHWELWTNGEHFKILEIK